jgi:propionyl-CoA carboxylase alpha chain
MPGTVVRVAVAEGAPVAAGEVVVVLEAMKMEHAVRAPSAGVVTSLPVAAGETVRAGQVLAVVGEG